MKSSYRRRPSGSERYLVLENYLRYRNAVSAVERYRGEVSLPQARYPGVPATSPDTCVDVAGSPTAILQNCLLRTGR